MLIDPERSDVNFDGGRHVPWQSLDFDLPKVMLNDSTFSHAVRLADDVDRDIRLNLDVAVDLQEIDVQEISAHRTSLNLTEHGEVLRFRIKLKVDQYVQAGLGGECLVHFFRVYGYGNRIHSLPVKHPRHCTRGARPPGGTLALLFSRFYLEGDFHRD